MSTTNMHAPRVSGNHDDADTLTRRYTPFRTLSAFVAEDYTPTLALRGCSRDEERLADLYDLRAWMMGKAPCFRGAR
ncbi:MAG: hypothetical protein U0414_22390 [Polyangiaceae bacterium]